MAENAGAVQDENDTFADTLRKIRRDGLLQTRFSMYCITSELKGMQQYTGIRVSADLRLKPLNCVTGWAFAKQRLVVIAPALPLSVAEALAAWFDDLDQLDIRVIVDADAEVYRLGFGEREALNVIRDAATRNLLDLREQSGERIGVVIADENTMVFAPVSKNIEAGSNSAEQPNAIMLKGASTDDLARAAGADRSTKVAAGEIGNAAPYPTVRYIINISKLQDQREA